MSHSDKQMIWLDELQVSEPTRIGRIAIQEIG